MTSTRLWSGPIAFLLLIAGTLAIGAITPDYILVRQTVSELGEVGSPGQTYFTVLLCIIAAGLVVFASAVARSLRQLDCSILPAYFVIAFAISCAGVGIFSFPHPLHNVFGLSETVGMQGPLVTALVCWRNPRTRQVALFSFVMYVVVLLAIAVNLIPVFRPATLWPLIKPYFGVVQRSLFVSWFGWCTGFAMLLLRACRTEDAVI